MAEQHTFRRFIFSVTPQDVFEEEIAAITHHIGPIDAVICGHSGIAFEREISGIHWINAGRHWHATT